MVDGQFKVWCADLCEENEADQVEGSSAEDAAEIWTQDNYGDLEYPQEVEVMVRTHDGKLLKILVECEEVTTFSAREITDKSESK